MMIYKAMTCIALVVSTALMAVDEELVVLDAAHADYDGKKITLTGDVVVNHDLGTLCANQMTLRSIPGVKKVRFGLMHMSDHVKLAFKDGGKLSCACSDVDYSSLSGTFSGDISQEYVVYIENCRNQKEENQPLVIKSRHMAAKLMRECGDVSKTVISDITAEDNVTINYNHDFIATADHAVYQRDRGQQQDVASSVLPGVIILRAIEQGGHCQVTNCDGDMICATQIGIDTVKRQLMFTQPKGALQTRKCDSQEKVDFSADFLIWDDAAQMLTLRDGIEVNQKGIGTLTTAKEMKLRQCAVDGKKALCAMETESDTVLTYRDEDSDLCHTLTCHGPMKVDHVKKETQMHSPAGIQDQQVFFKDERGEIYADDVVVKYDYVEHAFVLKKLILSGNVKIFNRLNMPEKGGKIANQYILAEQVEYFPHTKEMIFKSKPKGRVLLFDKENSLQISAPSLKIIRDAATKKESFQGIGDVRFSFAEHEFEQLRQRFSLGKIIEQTAAAAAVETPL